MKNAEDHNWPEMPPEELRKWGYQFVNWVVDYFSHPEEYPVLAQVEPGDIRSKLPASPPQHGDPMELIFSDFQQQILPGITHWNHPSFFAYFSMTGSGPGVLGELLISALNVNAMLWRTSPAATELEEAVLDWLRQLLGLPEGFFGIVFDSASVSSLCAMAAAREAVPGLDVREKGLSGRPNIPRLRLYSSEQSHSSIDKGAILLGIGKEGIRKIPTDKDFRMDPMALDRAIREDVAGGWKPFCVAATVGTTSTTSVDPVPAVADICERHGIWLHVDAAYGGSAAIVPEMRWVLEGCERADSLVVNPHKWLFTQVDCSACYTRRPDILKQAFALVPEYLKTTEGEAVTNFMDYGIQLGRRFRALKLWMILRYFGATGLADRIRRHIRLARDFASWIDADRDYKRLAPAPFSTVCFRACPEGVAEEELDELNQKLLDAVNNTGKVFLSHTRLEGRFSLRLAIGNLRTTEEHVKAAWDLLKHELEKLKPKA